MRVQGKQLVILTYMMTSEAQPVPGLEIRKNMRVSKSLFSYHVNRLRHNGLIIERFRSGCTFYEVTEKGKVLVVQNSSAGLMKPLVGLHNIAFRFKIVKGEQPRLAKSVKLRGWTKYQCFYKGRNVESTPKHLIVMPNKTNDRMYGTDPFELQQRARDKAISVADYFSEKYNIMLGSPEVSRKPHFGFADPVARLSNTEVTTPDGKIDDSEGCGGEIEFFSAERAKQYLEMPERLARIECDIRSIKESLSQPTGRFVLGRFLLAELNKPLDPLLHINH